MIKSGGTTGEQSMRGRTGMRMVRKHDGIGKGEEGMKLVTHRSFHCSSPLLARQ
jgi:hypothetical protein